MATDLAEEPADNPSPKSRHRALIATGFVLTLLFITLAWQLASRPAGSTSRSVSWAKAACLGQVSQNSSELVPTGKPTTVIVSFDHVGPLNGTKEGTTWIVLKDGAAESGFACALSDDGASATFGPVATQIRSERPLAQQVAYMGSTYRTAYFGLVTRVPSSVTRVSVVTGRGTQVLRPVGGIAACILRVPEVKGYPVWAGVLISFNASGRIVGTTRF